MATIDRIDPGYTAWTPSASGIATDEDSYVGRHRKPGSMKSLSLRRMFHVARHRTR